MNLDSVKALAIVLNISGTFLVAYRVKIILDSVLLAVTFHDKNFEMIVAQREGLIDTVVVVHGTASGMDSAQKLGTKLLVLGFAFQLAGLVLHLLSL